MNDGRVGVSILSGPRPTRLSPSTDLTGARVYC